MASLTIPAGANMPPNVSVMDKTVCISITFGCLGNTRKVSTSQVEVDADKDFIHVSKSLIESKELGAIKSHDGHTMSWLKTIRLPSLFRTGVYLIPIPAIERVQAFLTNSQSKRTELVQAFLAVYEAQKADAEERLKGLYNPADYPSLARVEATFTFEWAWVSFATPGRLKEISADFFKAEQDKAAKQWTAATEEITLLLRSTASELVDHLVEVLTPGEDGKPKRFHATTVTKLNEFLENFSIRNVTDDKVLASIVDSAQKLLNGVDVKDLRENEAVRDGVHKSFELVKTCLDSLVTEGGSRKIQFED
jgi:hypothetical protein